MWKENSKSKINWWLLYRSINLSKSLTGILVELTIIKRIIRIKNPGFNRSVVILRSNKTFFIKKINGEIPNNMKSIPNLI